MAAGGVSMLAMREYDGNATVLNNVTLLPFLQAFRSFKEMDIALKDSPFNNDAMRVIGADQCVTVYLMQPTPDRVTVTNGRAWVEHGKEEEYEVVLKVIAGVVEITTATIEFYNSAKAYLTLYYGSEPSESNEDQWCVWKIMESSMHKTDAETPDLETPVSSQEPDVEAQAERHFEMMADMARGK